jgi:hypothetical protein
MRFRGLCWLILAALAVVALGLCGPASAQTTLYKALCQDSSLKRGPEGADLTNAPGIPITCLGVTLGAVAGGHQIVQFITADQSVLGFGGDALDFKSDPKFITLPLKRLYLPSRVKNGSPEIVDGAEGVCFLDGRDVKSLKGILCVAQVKLGDQHVVYQVQSHITGQAQSLGAPAKEPPAKAPAAKGK